MVLKHEAFIYIKMGNHEACRQICDNLKFYCRKREERMRKVNERREQANREDMESKNRMIRTMEERSRQADDLKEEKMKEEQEKQRLR